MRITRNNYEQYFLDFVEGRLDATMEKELQVFLDTHPDLKADLDDFDTISIRDSHELYPYKEKIRKSVIQSGLINESNIDRYLFNYLENNLDDKERAELEKFLELNPAFVYDLDIWRKTRLEPEENITYPGREDLKKKVYLSGRVPLGIFIPAAAVIVLILAIGGIFLLNERQAVPPSLERVPTAKDVIAEQVPVMPSVPLENHDLPLSQSGKRKNLPANEVVEISQMAGSREEIPVFTMIEPLEVDAVENHRPDLAFAGPETRATLPGPSTVHEESRTRLIGRILANFIDQGREILSREPEKDAERVTSPAPKGFMRFANATIRGYNTLTDNNLALEIQRDPNGNVLGYSLINNDGVILSRDKNNP